MTITNLGDTFSKIQQKMIYWRDSDTMEAQEELAALQNPVSLPIPAGKAPVIDLLSSIPEEQEIHESPAGIFLLWDSKGYPRPVRPKMYQCSQDQDQELLWDLMVMLLYIQHFILEKHTLQDLKLFHM